MNNEPEEWEEPERKTSRKEEPEPWETEPGYKPDIPASGADRIGFGAGLGIGFGTLILLSVICAVCQSAVPFILGSLVMVSFAFSPATRMIFVGYLTLIALFLLIFAVVCGSMFRS